jgi:aminoglycoside phosphotransferase (APT) family kinase protein
MLRAAAVSGIGMDSTLPASTELLAAAAGAFAIYGRFVSAGPYGSGHINDTFVAEFDQAGARLRYILQRINRRIFKDIPALMDNIQRVSAHAARRASDSGLADASRRALTLVATRDGSGYWQDAAGEVWRCYLFIEGARSFDLVETPPQAYEAARSFGDFQRILVDLPGPRLKETIPDFHNTRKRFGHLQQAIASDPLRRAARIGADLDFALKREPMLEVLPPLAASGAIPERITHNDTKFNNVLLDNRSGQGICVIDLDTVMPGLALYDFGDLVRSATNSAREDERDLVQVTMRMPIYRALVAGYLSSAGQFLNEAERAHLAFAGKLITFEIGLRFLTDFIEGDPYFKIARPQHNLDRARNQFALVRSIETQEAAMQSVALRGTK